MDKQIWGALKSLQCAAITNFRLKNLQRLTNKWTYGNYHTYYVPAAQSMSIYIFIILQWARFKVSFYYGTYRIVPIKGTPSNKGAP